MAEELENSEAIKYQEKINSILGKYKANKKREVGNGI